MLGIGYLLPSVDLGKLDFFRINSFLNFFNGSIKTHGILLGLNENRGWINHPLLLLPTAN
jgi:hypothetical protein